MVDEKEKNVEISETVKNNIEKLETDTIYAGIKFCCPTCTNVFAVIIL